MAVEQLGLTANVTAWKMEKRIEHGEHAGTLFEVIEGGDGKPTVVTYRVDGIADPDSYARDLPCRFGGTE